MDCLERTGATIWFESSVAWPRDREAEFGTTRLVPLLKSEVPFDYASVLPGVVFLWERDSRVAVATSLSEAQASLTGIEHPESLSALGLEWDDGDERQPPAVGDQFGLAGSVDRFPLNSDVVSGVPAASSGDCLASGVSVAVRPVQELVLQGGFGGAPEVKEGSGSQISWIRGWLLECGYHVTMGCVPVAGQSVGAGRVDVSGYSAGAVLCWPSTVGAEEFRPWYTSGPVSSMPVVFGLAAVAVYCVSRCGEPGVRYAGVLPVVAGSADWELIGRTLAVESDPGYCYLSVVKKEYKPVVAREYGPWLPLSSVALISPGWLCPAAMRRACVSVVAEGTLHVGLLPDVPLVACGAEAADQAGFPSGLLGTVISGLRGGVVGHQAFEGWVVGAKPGGLYPGEVIRGEQFYRVGWVDQPRRVCGAPDLMLSGRQHKLIALREAESRLIYGLGDFPWLLVCEKVGPRVFGIIPLGGSHTEDKLRVIADHSDKECVYGFWLSKELDKRDFPKAYVWNPLGVLRGTLREWGEGLHKTLSEFVCSKE